MIDLDRPRSLFVRTALALAAAFLLFGLVSTGLLRVTLIQPHTRQAADDLASFLVLVAQIWVELPPHTRGDYERELFRRHRIKVINTEAPLPTDSDAQVYLRYLEEALSRHVGHSVTIHRHPDHSGWLWADFPIGGRIMRLGFRAFAVSLLLVRRITHPLAKMAEATHRIGVGDFGVKLPETGPRELANLAHRLNLMEEQIRQLIENRTTLLAGISHDLRTPLARMRLELEMLRTETNVQLVKGLYHDITEMERLIAQTLLLARGFDGEQESRVEINELLRETADEFRKAGSPVDSRTGPPCTRTLRINALRRVVVNLVENALLYSEAKPVMLDCAASEDGHDICVSDSGPGIPAQEHEAIFQPFHRLEGSRSKATGGSGLGLAIVRQLCQANGWQVSVQNRPEGGSRFVVHLPAPNP